MNKFLKRLCTLALACAVLTGVMACGGQASSSEGTPQAGSASAANSTAATGEAGSIRVWVTSGTEDDIYKQTFENMRQELGIEITDEYYPKDELDSKLQVAPVVGDTPDMIIVDYLNVAAYDELDLIADVSARLTEELRADLLQSVIDEVTYDNRMLGTAQFDAGMAMWANKSMLEEAGIRIPVSYTEAWDKEEFEDALAKLKEIGVEYPLYIRQNKPTTLYYTYMPVIASFGGDYMDRTTMTTEGVLDSDSTVAAFDYLSWMVEMGYVNAACDYEDAFFGRQESAIALLGHWKYTDHVENLGDDAIIIPIPDFGNGVFTCSGSTVWCMTTAAEANGNADAVWAVMESSMSEENINLITDFNGAIPSRISVLDTKEELQEGGRLYLYREQLEAGLSKLRPLTPAHSTLYSAMENVYSDILAGADARESLESAASYVDDIIYENNWNVEE